MKTIIPLKIILTQDGQGNIIDALLQYQINTDGQISQMVFSVSVKDALTVDNINLLFNTAVASAQQSEGI